MKIGKKVLETGLEDIIIVDTLPEGYGDVTTVNNWIKYGSYLFKDYKYIRKRFQPTDFSTLTDAEKVIVCQYKASNEENCKTYLGDTFEYWMSYFDMQSQDCRRERFSLVKTVFIKNVSVPDRYSVLGFLNTTQLVDNYVKYGIEGSTEGDPIEGILDFVNATTGGAYENTGMRALSLTIINGLSKDELCDRLIDIFRSGS